MAGYSSCFCKQRRHRASQESPSGATSALPLTEFVLLSFVFICTPCSPKRTLLVLLLSLLAEVLACVYHVYHFSSLSTLPIGAGEVLQPIPSDSFPEGDVGWSVWSKQQSAGAAIYCILPVCLHSSLQFKFQANQGFPPPPCPLFFFFFQNGTVTIVYFWCCTPDISLSLVSQGTT